MNTTKRLISQVQETNEQLLLPSAYELQLRADKLIEIIESGHAPIPNGENVKLMQNIIKIKRAQ